MQNTLQQLGLHAVHNQSAPLRVEVMTSTHPAFNLFYVELHIPWLLIARGAFGEWGKQLKALQFPMTRDSSKSTLFGLVSIHPSWRPAQNMQGSDILHSRGSSSESFDHGHFVGAQQRGSLSATAHSTSLLYQLFDHCLYFLKAPISSLTPHLPVP